MIESGGYVEEGEGQRVGYWQTDSYLYKQRRLRRDRGETHGVINTMHASASVTT